uniref:Ankyrin-3-like n=1 Tax=Saccoglossus kowalevskii TaxID=10224 RepID=A0ABM0LZ51_SACKO|nr:PREDICTED: ankyrin-3-like [Saccoglossus kowalevskii]
MLNDRWTINLALKVFEKMIRLETLVDSEDLVQADPMAMSAYLCVYFMCGFKLRQARSVINRLAELVQLNREANYELENFPAIINTMQQLKRKKELKSNLDAYEEETKKLHKLYDVGECERWWKHIDEIQAETRGIVAERMRQRFDTITVPRNITITDLCLSMVINLNLTSGSGFYHAKSKETFTPDRKIVLKDVNTGDFIDDFTQAKGQKKVSIRKILGLPKHDVIEVNPSDYPQYEMYFESQSRNKTLKAGSIFLYQVFPGNTLQWELLYFKAAKMGELDTVQKLVVFFKSKRPTFINAKEKRTGNTALHWAARNGHYNSNGASPFFCAVEGLTKGISQLLVEWGANVHAKNNQSRTAFVLVRNDELKVFLLEYYEHLTDVVPKLMDGDVELLKCLVEYHVTGIRQFSSLRSRCVNGSTLIHTAAYFGAIQVIKVLLKERVDVNLLDYKGATPLHRAKDIDTIKVLLDNGALINAEDSEGNTALHVKCYGESNKPTETQCIKLLLAKGISLTHRNNKQLLAAHCCAMQGRVDALEILLEFDKNAEIPQALDKEDPKSPPSLIHLAIANDFLDCSQWLVDNGYEFKSGEQDLLVHRILTEQIKCKNRVDVMKFLLDNGADMSQRYAGGNTALHYASGMTGPTDILELLIAYGANVDAVNDDSASALFFSMQCNNMYAASVLIDNGANVRHKNIQGLSSFDCIMDFDEWIECPYFNDEIKARLKAYSLKHTRDLVRAITKKVKGNQSVHVMQQSSPTMPASLLGSQSKTLALNQSQGSLQTQSKMLIPISPQLQQIPMATSSGRTSGVMFPPLKQNSFLMY